jgi:2-isopropylmalate synthase
VLRGSGNGPIDALIAAFATVVRAPVRVHHYEERATGQGADATAIAFAELACDAVPGSTFGVGMHANLVTASIRAVISGINRIYGRGAGEAFLGAPGAAADVATTASH